MLRKLHDVLVFSPSPARRENTQFNAQLLEQRREDAFLAMYRLGMLR
ncbi:hypothetical protein [Arthrobacter sp. UKPF54-2]|nr:hypothetical protein [Arthrobacter sp. UKPF54-2]